MPDDANGNYTLPSGYLAVTGQTIQPSQHNPPLEDIGAALTGRLPRSGVAPMTGPLKTVTGSAAVPAISPNSNPSVGIYWTATGIAFAGTVAGVRFIGELIPWTMLTAPALTVLPDGRTLLRASYPDLWSKAQTEIAAGNIFYNNGNGSTTFGIGDVRGRLISAIDNMGGTDSNRNPSITARNTMGGVAGSDTHTLTQAQLPAFAPTFSGIAGVVNVTTNSSVLTSQATSTTGGGAFSIGVVNGQGAVSSQGVFTPQGTISVLGGGAHHNNVQNTMFLQFVLYAGA